MNILKKQQLIKHTLALIILSGIAKGLSILCKVVIASMLSSLSLTYFQLCSPTMVFFIALAQIGLPSTITKIVSDETIKNEKPIIVSLTIALIDNILLLLFLSLFIPILANNYLKQPATLEVLKTYLILLPLVTISGILKGFFIGKNEHFKVAFTQILEELSRIIFIITIFKCFPYMNAIDKAKYAMHSISIGEITTIIYLGYFLFKRKIHFHYIKMKQKDFSFILNLALPISFSRLIGSFTYFLEPIIISSNKAIQTSYSEIHAFVVPLLTLSSFISAALASYVYPKFTKEYSLKHYKKANTFLFLTIFINLCFAFSFAFIIYLFPNQIMYLLYHKDLSHLVNKLRLYLFPFALLSIQPILSNILHSLNYSKFALLDTISGCIIRIATLYFLLPKLQDNALLLAIFLSMLTTTVAHVFNTLRAIFKHNK